jgi:pimeloyl-ACP methyl ester carboxylesterase
VHIAGHDWVYDSGGTGTDVVLVHGFAGSRADWYQVIPELPPRHRYVVVDLPGWGSSQRIDDADYGIEAQAERLAEFLRAEAVIPVHLVGHSMGGHIAGMLAVRHPELVATLTLVANSGVHFEPTAIATEILAGGNPFNVNSRAEWDALLAEAYERPPHLPARIVDALIAAEQPGHAFSTRVLLSLRTGRNAFLLEDAMHAIRIPVHVIWCRYDRVLDVSSIETMQRELPGARYSVIEEGCGHMPMHETPGALAALIGEGLVDEKLADSHR